MTLKTSHNPRSVVASLVLAVAVAVALLGVLASTSGAAPGDTTLVNASSTDTRANGLSRDPSISANGRYVAFVSGASNLVAGDTNDRRDLFVRNLRRETTERVNVSSSGAQANKASDQPSISSDGRFVAFESKATNLVAGDTNGEWDVFVHDRRTGTTERVNVSSSGAQANRTSEEPSISPDGRFVAFQSYATNLVARDTNRRGDVFVHDRQTGTTRRVSVSSSGTQANRYSFLGGSSSISANGHFITVGSDATNLVAGDTNGRTDIFVRDRQRGTTRRVSVSSSGNQGNRDSYAASISANGRFVAFVSEASNLVPSDTNRKSDLFVRNRKTGTTRRVVERVGYAFSLSANGRFVAFESYGRHLVPGDTNGHKDVFVRRLRTGTTKRVSVSSSGAQANLASKDPSINSDGRFVAFESKATNLARNDFLYRNVFVHESRWPPRRSGS